MPKRRTSVAADFMSLYDLIDALPCQARSEDQVLSSGLNDDKHIGRLSTRSKRFLNDKYITAAAGSSSVSQQSDVISQICLFLLAPRVLSIFITIPGLTHVQILTDIQRRVQRVF
jgi:hypothetical protein